ncbi:MAG: terpene cyclase/mutase family protein [Acidobacteria bacterium]|nr:terpene cyclase/mutase family protein [Acidobacteriota bacterium]
MAAALLDAQNADGGWGAQAGGRSWTETTAWALLSLHGRDAKPGVIEKGLAWLRGSQLPEGGWAAAPGIGEKCWVTAVAALLPPALLGVDVHGRAMAAVRAGAEKLPDRVERVRRWMLGQKPAEGPVTQGWPWVPGTAPWVVPSAVSILALRKYGGEGELVDHARNYLLARQCKDGGWNHGSSRALGYDTASYPETTGLALLALRGVRGEAVERGLAAAERHARKCQTMEGAQWLRLALQVHAREGVFEPPAHTAGDLREMAIGMIVERCLAGEALL